MVDSARSQDPACHLPPLCLSTAIHALGLVELGHVAAVCSSWKAVAMSEALLQAFSEARYGVAAAAHGRQSYPTWRQLLIDDNACGGFWAMDIDSTAGWQYNNGVVHYINCVRWLGLKRPVGGDLRIVVLVDALGEDDLREAHETTLIVRYSDDDDDDDAMIHSLDPTNYCYLSQTDSRHVCLLEFEFADLEHATEVHWVYNGDWGSGLEGTDYNAGFILRREVEPALPATFRKSGLELPQGCQARRFQRTPITYAGLEQASTIESLLKWEVPSGIIERYRHGDWGV
eukprot:TRINITY_DN53247_c0_g1_i1.p1 TRINITY_DN53247_c0_g1~~TRINITY_DN53247_c0_g1_i1.p1  ORF type:complete len:333 (-),score=15.28 TRINITY_DN53247_c0_g1_i1:250-1110(-)